jgi:hypothetical protein
MVESAAGRWQGLSNDKPASQDDQAGSVSFVSNEGLFSVPLADFNDGDIAVFASTTAPLHVRRAYFRAILAHAPRIVNVPRIKSDVRELFPDSAFVFVV